MDLGEHQGPPNVDPVDLTGTSCLAPDIPYKFPLLPICGKKYNYIVYF